MPLRSLIYFARLLRKEYVNQDIYDRKLVKIPMPQFIVFYNGVDSQPEYQEMKLSDSFIKNDDNNKKIMLELVCKVYNINVGNNKILLERCKWLAEYMVFVDKVREYHKGHDADELHDDIEWAIDYCIEHDVLREFLISRRAEVTTVTAVDYTFERRLTLKYNEGKEDGERDLLLNKISKKLAKNKSVSQIADELEEDEDTITKLIKEMSVPVSN